MILSKMVENWTEIKISFFEDSVERRANNVISVFLLRYSVYQSKLA